MANVSRGEANSLCCQKTRQEVKEWTRLLNSRVIRVKMNLDMITQDCGRDRLSLEDYSVVFATIHC